MIELKKCLDIDPEDASEDVKLGFINEWASNWIEELLGRPGCTLKARTEFYKGSGTPRLNLKHRPVYPVPVPQVFVDEIGWWGAPSGSFDASTTQLTYGESSNNGAGFTVQWDQDDGTSRSAILVRMNGLWPRPSIRQQGLLSPFVGDSQGNVKVVYTAGWTADTMPAMMRMVCNLLAARLRYILPIGQELASDSYEETSIGIVTSERMKLLSLVMPAVLNWKNWTW